MPCKYPYLLSQTIDLSASINPDQEAFRFNGNSLSYTELVKKSNALAHVLKNQGVKRSDRVGIFLDSSLESAIAIYGIWKAGAAYVSLDPHAPLNRLLFIIQDCDIQVLISEDSKCDTLKELLTQETELHCIIGVSETEDWSKKHKKIHILDWHTVDSAPCDYPPSVRVIEQDIAYIMYTSGSTGKPKGLIHTHYSGLSYAKLSVETYDVRPEDRVANSAPLHFDISTFGFFSSMLAGSTTVLIPDLYSKFPANLSQLMTDERLTIWYSVPFILSQLADKGALHHRDLSTLRWVLFGGEPFPVRPLRKLMMQIPNARFSNVYGPAEVNQCTYYHLPTIPKEGDAPIPLGQIWNNTEGLLLNNKDEPDTEGELVIRSPTMMSGYWNRPDLNEKAFFYPPNPVSIHLSERFYRTGDLVKQDTKRIFHFIGRKDHQVKIRGFRVELGEIESMLQAHRAVEDACAFITEGLEKTQQIEVAVVIVSIDKEEIEFSVSHLYEHLKLTLPWYAIPTSIHEVKTIPRTSSGKADRIRLISMIKNHTL